MNQLGVHVAMYIMVMIQHAPEASVEMKENAKFGGLIISACGAYYNYDSNDETYKMFKLFPKELGNPVNYMVGPILGAIALFGHHFGIPLEQRQINAIIRAFAFGGCNIAAHQLGLNRNDSMLVRFLINWLFLVLMMALDVM